MIRKDKSTMLKEISIGKQKTKLLANAATPLYYKQTFNKDVISKIYNSEDRIRDVGDLAPELAFIMQAQATASSEGRRTKPEDISKEKYIEYLEGFDPLDFLNASQEILGVYLGDAMAESKPKKKEGKTSEN